MIALRELTSDDWRVWRRVRLAGLAEAPYAFGARLTDWQAEGDRESRWRSWLDRPDTYQVVAEQDSEPVGMAAAKPVDAEAYELISMWVSPQVRGRGVGARLVAAVEDWVRGQGAASLRLAVARGNDAAVGFYRRQGFTYTGEPGTLMPDGVRTEDTMVKVL